MVEINETVICRRKYNRGRQVSSIWLFGVLERLSKKRFVVPLSGDRGENRDRATLWPMIREYILPGSIVYSDCWKAHDGLDNPDLWEQFGVDPNYTHHKVNHKENFVDSQNPQVHTQNIERAWRDITCHVKRPGIKSHHLKQYLSRYLFLKAHSKDSRLHAFFTRAAILYPPQSLELFHRI